MNLGIVASCIPTLKPPLQLVTGTVQSWLSRTRTRSSTADDHVRQPQSHSILHEPSKTSLESFALADGDSRPSNELRILPERSHSSVKEVADSTHRSASSFV